MPTADISRPIKRDPITPGFLSEILKYDPLTGKLFWKERPVSMFSNSRACRSWNSRYAGKEAFTADLNGYRQGMINYRTLYAHRVAWAIYYGEWPTDQIDHINCDRSDNRIANLRSADAFGNNRNQMLMKNNTSGFKGVSRARSGRWVAKIMAGGKYKHLGTFDSAVEAAKVYARAAAGYHGEFARTE